MKRRYIGQNAPNCFRSIAILAVAGFLGGCIYVPSPEKPLGGKSSVDFRNRVGIGNSSMPLRVGSSTRDDVARLLGPAKFRSEDGSVLGYTCDTISGLRIFLPLFFLPVTADAHEYLLRLQFGSSGLLAGYAIQQSDRPLNDGLISVTSVQPNWAMGEPNTLSPKLYSVDELEQIDARTKSE